MLRRDDFMNKQSSPAGANHNRVKFTLGPIILIGAGILILLSLAVWKLSKLPAATTPQADSPFQIPYPEITRVSLADAKAAYDSGLALFVDVRDAGSYASGHVKGAINVPLADIENRLSDLPGDRWIILYCT
jgi:hypothetical protein